MSKPSVSIRGRIDLSQRTYQLPDGRAAQFVALAPLDRYRDAVGIPREHREPMWLAADGQLLRAVVDLRTDAARGVEMTPW